MRDRNFRTAIAAGVLCAVAWPGVGVAHHEGEQPGLSGRLGGPHARHESEATAKKKGKRFGIEGRLVAYDEANETITVKVMATKVSGAFGSGGIAGGKAPSSVKRLAEIAFAVVPEGSVLRRTVFKSESGIALDKKGTKAGFARAFEIAPKDKNVILSFEKSPAKDAGKDGVPEFLVKMIQLRISPEEAARRFEELSTEE